MTPQKQVQIKSSPDCKTTKTIAEIEVAASDVSATGGNEIDDMEMVTTYLIALIYFS